MPLTKSAFYNRLTQLIDQYLDKRGLAGNAKAIVPAAYVSGNPTIQKANESSTTLGSKTHKVKAPISNRNGLKPAASQSILYSWDADGNRVVNGAIVDLSAVVVDSDFLMGLRPVAPGNTLLLTANTQQSTTSATYVTVKRLYVTRPGTYRLKGELSRTGGTTSAQLGIELPDATVVVATSPATYSGTVFPVFGSQFTLDMTVAAPWGSILVIQLKNDSGPAQTGYIQNCTLNYADASASLSPLDSVLVN